MTRRRVRRSVFPHYRRPRSVLLFFVFGLSALAVLCGRLEPPPPTGPRDRLRFHQQVYTVTKVIDGDTLGVDVPDGKYPTTRIRLRGIDTPEVDGSPAGAMLYGPEASAFTRQAALGREVRLVLDPNQETRDAYGRLLAYVYLLDSGKMLNELLIETGHAYADLRFEHVLRDRFRALEEKAREARLGLWAEVRLDQMPRWRRRYEEQKARRRGSPSGRRAIAPPVP